MSFLYFYSPGIYLIYKRRKHPRCYQCYFTFGYYLEKQTCSDLIFWLSDFHFTCCSCDLCVFHLELLTVVNSLRYCYYDSRYHTCSTACWMCIHCTGWENNLFKAEVLLLNQSHKDIPMHSVIVTIIRKYVKRECDSCDLLWNC